MLTTQVEQQDERANLPSASYMPILWPCPGAWQRTLAVKAPDKVEEWTTQGEAIHLAREMDDDSLLDEDEAKISQRLKLQEETSISNWKEEFSLFGQPCSEHREERLWVRDAKTLNPLCSAKLDQFILCGCHAFLNDYKSGYGKSAPADSNRQLLTQVVALWHEYPELSRIRAAINASRIKSYFDYVDFDQSDIIQADVLLRAKLREVNSPNPPVNPGQHCRYCKAKAWCAQAIAYSSLHQQLAPVPGVQLQNKEQAEIAVAQLAPASLAEIQKKKAVIQAILEAVNDRLKAMTDQELGAIGMKRKPGAVRKVITDQPAAWDVMVHELGPLAQECIKCDRKAFAEHLAGHLKITKKAGVECADKLLAKCTKEEQNDASITEI